jgi:hypothetical protein
MIRRKMNVVALDNDAYSVMLYILLLALGHARKARTQRAV